MIEKKLMVSLSCGHTLILTKYEAARAASGSFGVGGQHFSCKKCPWDAPPRRATEKQWINEKDKS